MILLVVTMLVVVSGVFLGWVEFGVGFGVSRANIFGFT